MPNLAAIRIRRTLSMAEPDSKRRSRRTRLPILPPPVPERGMRAAVALGAGGRGEEDSIYTLRGYKAWAARVKAAWDSEA
jgi:hypothetical protein